MKVDTQAPQLLSTLPQDHALNISPNAEISATFNEPLSEGAISVIGEGVSGNSSRSGNKITFNHSALDSNNTFRGQTSNVTDTCGNITPNSSWTFSTAPFEALVDQPLRAVIPARC